MKNRTDLEKEDHAKITNLIQDRIDQRKSTYVSFIDFEKAFDWINRDLLLYKLIMNGIDGKFYFAIKSLYCQTSNNILSSSFTTISGVRQGDNLSPTLFKIFINDLSNELKTPNVGVHIGPDIILSHLLYADDLALIAESEADLQELLNRVSSWCQKWHINAGKSKIVQFRKRLVNKTTFNFKEWQIKLDIVSEYKYLGFIFNENMDLKISINDLSSRAGRSLGSCISRFKSMKDVGFKTYTQLYNSMVVPISDYFAGIWGIRKFEQSHKLQNRAIRLFLGLGPKTPFCAIQGDMGWTSPSCRHIIKIVKLWNRIIKMEQSRLPFTLLKNLIHNNGGWIKKIRSLSEDFNINTNNYTHIPVSVVMDTITQKEQTEWRNTIASKPELITFV